MDNLIFVCFVLILAGFLILSQKIDTRFGRLEKKLDEMKKQMDAYLKSQQKVLVDEKKALVDEKKALIDEKKVLIDDKKVLAADKMTLVDEKKVVEKLSVPEEKPIEKILEKEPEPVVPKAPVKAAVSAAPAAPKQKKMDYEKFIGENLFGKIGILIFVIGVGFFVKYAIDQNWINEIFRTILGFLTGVALLVVAERLQKKYRTFSSLLAGGAFAVFYLTVAIAFHSYHIFSQPVAFILLIGITVFMSVLSVVYNRRELAIVSLVGGFLAPFIVSSGEGSYLVLFTYVSILNLGMFGLSVYKKWSELPIVSFVFTCLILGGFILLNYSSESTIISSHMYLFTTLFYFIFLLPVFSILRGEKVQTMNGGLVFVIILNNFVYLFSGALFLRHMGLPFKASGLLSLFIALVNLGLLLWLWKHKRENYKFLVYTMLGLVITFVSITIPIQLDGNYVTLLWASEMVLLLWLYIKSETWIYEYGTKALVGLTFVSYLMDVYNVLHHHSAAIIFLNSSFATSLFVGLAIGAFALLMEYHRPFFSVAHRMEYRFWNPFMLLTSAIVLYYTFMMEFSLHFEGAVRSGAMFLCTAVFISGVCYVFRKRFPIEKHPVAYVLAIGANVLVYMINIWGNLEDVSFTPAALQWLAAAFTIVCLYHVARLYYTVIGIKYSFTVYLNILAVLLWVTIVRSFLWQVGVNDFSAGLSLSLSIAGFVQMGLGMRLHQKVMRIISLATFGVVLLKLVFDDLWAMPTVGKIIVFIILGLILLVLSFLYQRLKDVLFKNDEEEGS